ncbi:MAG: DUF4321 domain-containing protein [Candidatus Omnitrophica bacterium]|nr:DUF4321 domain-containing protein [Candidatus Omnitrophota bacterium]
MKVFYIILVLFLSAMIGSCIGEILLFFIHPGTFYYDFLSKSTNSILSINNLDLRIFKITFSINFKVNFFTLLGLIGGALYSLRKV